MPSEKRSDEKRTGGRPKDEEAAGAIKAATLKLLRARGYARVSIAAIASEASVARQTLYNRWKTKADLVLDALFEETQSYAAAPLDDPAQSNKAQLECFLVQVFAHLSDSGGTIRALIAAAQDDTAFREVFKDRFVKPREVMVTDLLQRAQAQGEIDADSDVALLSSFIHGAFWYALLNGEPVDAKLAKRIAEQVFR